MFWTAGCMARYEDYLRECEQFQILNQLEHSQCGRTREHKGLRYRLARRLVQLGCYLAGEGVDELGIEVD